MTREPERESLHSVTAHHNDYLELGIFFSLAAALNPIELEGGNFKNLLLRWFLKYYHYAYHSWRKSNVTFWWIAIYSHKRIYMIVVLTFYN